MLALVGTLLAITPAVMLTTRRPSAPPPPDPATLMRERLTSMRGALAAYRKTHQNHGPASLDALVQAKQLREIPLDPVTHSRTTWRLELEEEVRVSDDFSDASAKPKAAPEIVAIHSGARGHAPDGRHWSDF